MAPTPAPWVVFMAAILYVNAEDVVLEKPGDDVTLPCRATGVSDITKIVWTRSDLKSGDYVFFFREKRPYESYQHDLFRGRVQLKDRGLKDGDASVILKDVTEDDTGTYRCEVSGDGGEFNNSVYLQVIHPEVVVLATPGDDVTLQCRGPRVTSNTVIMWTRSDLESDGHVFFFRENRPYEDYHHPLFRGRVQLKDPDLKDGDASVILKDVTMNDTGTYECEVSGDGGKFKNSVDLQVIQPEVVVSVKPGDDVTLQCWGPRVTSITTITWTRSDLRSDDCVFFLRGKRLYEKYQHRLFNDRVQLKDPDLKDGNASVILKNVNVDDTGTYACQVFGDAARRMTRDTIGLKTVYLKVTPDPHGRVGLLVGAVVSVCLVLAGVVGVVGLDVWSRRRNQKPAQSAASEEEPLPTVCEE